MIRLCCLNTFSAADIDAEVKRFTDESIVTEKMWLGPENNDRNLLLIRVHESFTQTVKRERDFFVILGRKFYRVEAN